MNTEEMKESLGREKRNKEKEILVVS